MSSERPKLAPDTPKVITAWLSATGRSVYLTRDRNWSEDLADAEVHTGIGANDILAWAASDHSGDRYAPLDPRHQRRSRQAHNEVDERTGRQRLKCARCIGFDLTGLKGQLGDSDRKGDRRVFQ